jgi:hypothetical protein
MAFCRIFFFLQNAIEILINVDQKMITMTLTNKDDDSNNDNDNIIYKWSQLLRVLRSSIALKR